MAGNIVEYNAPPGLGLQPTETGITATTQAARRVQSRASEVASAFETVGASASRAVKTVGDIVVDHITQQNISSASAALAEKQNDYIQKWNNLPNKDDPTVLKTFRDGLESDLQQFKDKAFLTDKGQAWGERHIEAFREHMFQKTSADLSAIAGHKTITSIMKSANEWSATAMNDPSAVKFLLGQAEDGIAGIVDHSTNLTPAQQAQIKGEHTQKIKEQIARAAVFGAIQQNPEGGLALAADPALAPYINAVELKQFETYARQQARLKSADEEREIRLQEKAVVDRSDKRGAEYRAKIYSDDPAEVSSVTKQKINNDPELTNPEKDRLTTILEHAYKPEPDARVSRIKYMELTAKIAGVDGHPKMADDKEIYAAAKLLTVADFNRLRAEFAASKTPEGESIQRARGQFDKVFTPLVDAGYQFQYQQHSMLGAQRMYEFKMEAQRQEEVLRKEGKDPHLVYDPRPNNPYYFGRPENIAKYRVSLKEAQDYEKKLKEADATKFTPPPSWEYSESRKQYRDPATKKIYDASGKEVK